MPAQLIKYARSLRRHGTKAELLLWHRLRAKQMHGLKFRRQQPIADYIVDFVCFEKKVVVELDGGQHAGQKTADEKRDQFLKTNGFTVLRFWNNDVFDNLSGVLEKISQACLHPSPAPPIEGGELM